MLWRYVGVTLVALGGAMLVAPDPQQQTGSALAPGSPPAPDSGAGASSARASAPEAPSEPGPTAQVALPAAIGDVAGTRTAPGTRDDGTVRVAWVDSPLRAGPAAPEEMAGETSGQVSGTSSGVDASMTSAAAPADLPSFERPQSLRADGITAETLALIETTEDPAAPAGQSDGASQTDLLFVSGSRVNVRSGPSTSYAVIGSTTYGESVELLAFENEAWAWVRFSDDRMGYMARNFLTQDLGDG